MNKFLPVQWYEELPSTNTHLIECVREDPDLSSGTVVAARSQSAGRGRQGRSWQAEANRNLTFSFLWNASVSTEYVPSMAQAIAVGIVRYLQAAAVVPTIKWPNDVLVNGKKIAGILCETVALDAKRAIVAGVGLNVNMSAEDALHIDQPATSLAIESDHLLDIDDVLQGLLDALEAPLQQWALGGFSAFSEEYARWTVPPGTSITIRDGDRKVAATFLSYTPSGALHVQFPDGSDRTLYSGDLSFSADT